MNHRLSRIAIAAAARVLCAPLAQPLPPLGTLCVLSFAGAALAQPATVNVEITAQPLSQAIAALSRQAGVAIVANSEQLAGKAAPAVQGRMTLPDALNRLLAGSGLAARQDGNAWVIVAAPAPAAAGATTSTLGEVKVRARAEPERGIFGNRGRPGPVEPGVVTADALARYAAGDLEDVFAKQPEMAVGGGHAIAQKIYLRGIEDTLLNITVDGAPQAGQTFHHSARVQLEPELLKRVEALGGTGDATAGPGALGGVLRFVTKDPLDLLRAGERAGALLKAEYFSNGEGHKAFGSVFGRLTDDWSLLAALTRQDRKDYDDGAGQPVAATGSQQQFDFVKLMGQIGRDQTLRLSHERHGDEGIRSQRPQWVVSSFNRAYPIESERATWNLNYAWQPDGGLIDLALNLFDTDIVLDQNARFGPYRGRVESRGLDLRNTSRFPASAGTHEITYGVDRRSDRITLGPDSAPETDIERGTVTGLYAQGRFMLTPQTQLGAGARYDRYALTDPNGQQLKDSGFSPNLSLRHALTPQLTLLAGHARALRGPGVREAFKLDGIAYDPQLKAEKARTSELGFEYASGAWRFNGKAYDTVIADAINDPVGRPTLWLNVGDVKSRGALLHSTYTWQNLSVGAGLHHNRATLNGARLNGYEHYGLGISQGNTLTTSADWRVTPQIDLGWLGRYVQRIAALQTGEGTVRKPGYGVNDVYARWRSGADERVVVSLVVKNLFDKNYLDHGSNEDFQAIPDFAGVVGAREPGREIRLGVALRF
ncbi:TonB-dependent receptor [Sphaerotilus sp.]|uniref:TonB-dependent receptor n=1 Tax=Sphaerotilus sp. TaxID=2093942 RepID=UPI002ACD4E10|nr:TonB-dependent receptor [Sphaerotilus sp.]MDZ7855799.1 TonB-dependent receptor [Sphaerotilus sp.]